MIAVGPSQGDRPLGGSERSSLRGDPVAAGPSARLPGRPKGALPPGGKAAKRASGGGSTGDRSPGGSERSSFRGDPSRAVLQGRVREAVSATAPVKDSR